MNEIPMANPAVILRETSSGDAVLVNTDTATSIALNSTGFVIWQQVDGIKTVEQIIAVTHKRFSEVPHALDEDIKKMMKIFEEDGFIGFQWRPDKKNKRGQHNE